jgi:hypothetical protein
MRRGDAKPRRAARLTTAAGRTKKRAGSARARSARKRRTPTRAKAKLSLGHYLPACVATYLATASICAFVRTFLKAGMTWPPFVTCF